MSTKTKVKEAQQQIIDRIAECEMAVATLYRAYGDALPGQADFWQTLAGEEEEHVRLLKSLHRLLERGHILYGVGKFDAAALDTCMAQVAKERAATVEKVVSATHAMRVALDIESSPMDAHFYETVTSDAPEFAGMAARLLATEKRHIQMVQDKWTQQRARRRPDEGARKP